MSKAEFEQSVESEKLERSDFTIFTHDLKKTCDGFYNTVKANLPSIQVEEVTDDDDHLMSSSATGDCAHANCKW